MKVREIWVVIRNRKPLFVHGGTHKGMLIFTTENFANQYRDALGDISGIDIEKWEIPYFLDVLKSIEPIMTEGGIEWLIVNHPGQTEEEVTHLKVKDMLSLKGPKTFRISFTVPSQE